MSIEGGRKIIAEQTAPHAWTRHEVEHLTRDINRYIENRLEKINEEQQGLPRPPLCDMLSETEHE